MAESSDVANSVAAEWDDRYRGFADHEPGWNPNRVLAEYLSELSAGRALDVGCGLGVESIWLAGRGWKVTALDVSGVALTRAASRAQQVGVDVDWVNSRIEDARLVPGLFDLVTAFYPALRHSTGGEAQKALLASVAPGGTLLVVHHADVDVDKAKAHGFDPADYLSHDDLVAALDDSWDVEIQRRCPRDHPTGPELQHTHDDILLARRLV